MDEPILILNVEDSPADTELIARELERAGLVFSMTRVDSEQALRAALESSSPDIILADYNLPGFDGIAALRIACSLVPDTPFIFVSGSIGDERAVQALREGATDYVIKDRMSRLPVAVTRALEEKGERQLRRRMSQQNEMILQYAAEGIVGVNNEGKVMFANPAAAKITGFSVEELEAAPTLHSLIHHSRAGGEPCATEDCPVFGCLADGRSRFGEETLIRKSRELFPAHLNCSPMYEHSRITGWVVTFVDLSERNRLKNQLDQANRISALGRLAATMAHEFNNVLMGIQPFAEVIRRGGDGERISRAAEQIMSCVTRGKSVTADILRFTQASDPALQPVSMVPWLRQLLPELENLAGSGVEIRLEVPPDPIVVLGDPAQLQQVLTNLIGNARDAMSGSGVIAIQLEPATKDLSLAGPARASLTVRDTGCGMTPEVLEHIFEPLFTTKRTGTGLGLAVAREVIRRNGGEIWAESRPGEGTTFLILLPMTSAEAARPQAGNAHRRSDLRRIVLVEDEPAIASGIVLLLETEGVETRVATLGAEALNTIDTFAPDAVILDMSLPDMHGADVYKRIAGRHATLPILFSSGQNDDSVVRHLTNDHVAFLRKPYDLGTLMEALHRITQSRTAKRETPPSRRR